MLRLRSKERIISTGKGQLFKLAFVVTRAQPLRNVRVPYVLPMCALWSTTIAIATSVLTLPRVLITLLPGEAHCISRETP